MAPVALVIMVLCCTLAEASDVGVILDFDPPDPNEEVESVIIKRRDIEAYDTDGSEIGDSKLSMFWVTMDAHCYETSTKQLITPCLNGGFTVLNLRYGDNFLLDCMKVASTSVEAAIESIKAIVLVRFHLKVYYHMKSGKCFYKYFSLPVYACSPEDHYELAKDKCREMFPDEGDILVNHADDSDEDQAVGSSDKESSAEDDDGGTSEDQESREGDSEDQETRESDSDNQDSSESDDDNKDSSKSDNDSQDSSEHDNGGQGKTDDDSFYNFKRHNIENPVSGEAYIDNRVKIDDDKYYNLRGEDDDTEFYYDIKNDYE